jgi:hypothetical protein
MNRSPAFSRSCLKRSTIRSLRVASSRPNSSKIRSRSGAPNDNAAAIATKVNACSVPENVLCEIQLVAVPPAYFALMEG